MVQVDNPSDLTNIVGGADVGSVVGGLFGIGTIVGIVLLVVLILGALVFFGVFKKRPYKIFVWEPRANDYEVTIGSGCFEKGGKFETAFSPFDKLISAAPSGRAIRPGNQIHGFSKQRNDITWFEGDALKVNDTEIAAEPSLDPGMKVTVLNSMKDEFNRWQTQNNWIQALPWIAIVLACLIIIVPTMIGLGNVADSISKSAAANNHIGDAIMQFLNQTNSSHAGSYPVNPTVPRG